MNDLRRFQDEGSSPYRLDLFFFSLSSTDGPPPTQQWTKSWIVSKVFLKKVFYMLHLFKSHFLWMHLYFHQRPLKRVAECCIAAPVTLLCILCFFFPVSSLQHPQLFWRRFLMVYTHPGFCLRCQLKAVKTFHAGLHLEAIVWLSSWYCVRATSEKNQRTMNNFPVVKELSPTPLFRYVINAATGTMP